MEAQDTNAIAAPWTFPFFGLPRELRDIVYFHALESRADRPKGNDAPYRATFLLPAHPHNNLGYMRPITSTPHNEAIAPLLSVSPLFYREVSQVLWTSFQFDIYPCYGSLSSMSSMGDPDCQFFRLYEKTRLLLRHFRCAMNIKLRDTESGNWFVEGFSLSRITSLLPGLKSLKVDIYLLCDLVYGRDKPLAEDTVRCMTSATIKFLKPAFAIDNIVTDFDIISLEIAERDPTIFTITLKVIKGVKEHFLRHFRERVNFPSAVRHGL